MGDWLEINGGGAGVNKLQRLHTAAITADAELIAASVGNRIRVHALVVMDTASTVDTAVVLKSNGTGGTAVFAFRILTAIDPTFVLPWNPAGWFQNTAISQNVFLDLTSAGSPSLNVSAVYGLIPAGDE